MQILSTDRLIMRPFVMDDVAAAFSWLGDEEVMKFTARKHDKTIKGTEKRIEFFMEHQQQYGYSRWVMVEKKSQALIGDSGLMECNDRELFWTDLGYRLRKPYWGRGLATEAAKAWVKAAFETLDLDRLTAFTGPDNPASVRVLEKTGFELKKRGVMMGMDCLIFQLDKSG